jgi:hypothetical protein
MDGFAAVIELLGGACDAASAFADRREHKRQTTVERSRSDAIAACTMGAINLGFGPFIHSQYPRIGIAQMMIGGLVLGAGFVALRKWRRLRCDGQV